MSKVDWIAIKNEYINTDISQRKLAEKYGVSQSTLMQRAVREKWKEEKEENRSKIVAKSKQKVAEIIIEKEVDRIGRILELADALQDKAELGIGQLECYLQPGGKARDLRFVDVDRLKKLTSALKDLKEVVCAVEDIKRGGTEAGGGVVLLPEVDYPSAPSGHLPSQGEASEGGSTAS